MTPRINPPSFRQIARSLGFWRTGLETVAVLLLGLGLTVLIFCL